MKLFNKVRAIAIDTNGVLLKDVYSGAIKQFVERHGGQYTPELERMVFGSPHAAGGHIMATACRLPWTSQETIDAFLAEQKQYAASNPVAINPGAIEFLERMQGKGLRITSYGGSVKEVAFDPLLQPYEALFDRVTPYVNMGAFRPGMKEIAADAMGCEFDEIVFIDDLNRVADVCRALGCGFIGIPGGSYQQRQMIDSGVKYVLASLEQVDMALLTELDQRLSTQSLWQAVITV
jgi:beta-phosphoglucomutase-like phosphatase (HAD superfamily)